MRICLMTRSLPLHRSGGFERHSGSLAQWLADQGHEVLVITSRRPRSQLAATASVPHEHPSAAGQGSLEIVFCRTGLPGRYECGYWRESRSLFHARHADLPFAVLVGAGWGAAGVVTSSRWRRWRIPHLMIAHGTPRGDLATQRRRLGNTPLYWLRHCRHTLAGRRYRRALGACDRVIAISPSVGQSLCAEFGLAAPRVVVVANGVDTALFQPGPQTHPPGTPAAGGPVVITAARLHPEKGILLLLHAAQALLKSFPHLQVIIAGDGPQRSQLKRRAEQLGISPAVTFCGQLTEGELAALLARADLFAFPTTRNEGLPLAVLEAMAAGLPVVAANLPGVTDAVRHGSEGLLVPPQDPALLAAAISDLLHDPVRAAAMGRAGRTRCIQNFSRAHMLTGLEEEITRTAQREPWV